MTFFHSSEQSSEYVDLVDLLKRPEGKTLEFKRDLSTPEGAVRTIVAFANTAGGTLLVGVEDKTRHVRGVRDPLELEERLANLISDLVVPRLVPELEILPWRRAHVLAVQVHPSSSRPHFLKREGLDEGARVAAHIDIALFFGCRDVDAAYTYLRAKGLQLKEPVHNGLRHEAALSQGSGRV